MLVFLLLQEKKKAKKNDNWNFWICLFVPKWPFRDTELFSKKWVAETPIFIVFWGARFLAKLSKREILDTHHKKSD